MKVCPPLKMALQGEWEAEGLQVFCFEVSA